MGQIFFASLSQEQICKDLCTGVLVSNVGNLTLFSNIEDINMFYKLIFAFKYPLPFSLLSIKELSFRKKRHKRKTNNLSLRYNYLL